MLPDLISLALFVRAVESNSLSKAAEQSHLALANDKAHNTTEDMIANLEPSADCKGNWIRVDVQPNGQFTVTNGRNNFSKSYQAK